ncbi:hypothetical protein KC349_g327 [Hortaea werneckii]|nr:hypothetical protein KC349_g327 [Hortaea werneckii]
MPPIPPHNPTNPIIKRNAHLLMQGPPRLHHPAPILPPLRPRHSDIIAETTLHESAEYTTSLQHFPIHKPCGGRREYLERTVRGGESGADVDGSQPVMKRVGDISIPLSRELLYHNRRQTADNGVDSQQLPEIPSEPRGQTPRPPFPPPPPSSTPLHPAAPPSPSPAAVYKPPSADTPARDYLKTTPRRKRDRNPPGRPRRSGFDGVEEEVEEVAPDIADAAVGVGEVEDEVRTPGGLVAVSRYRGGVEGFDHVHGEPVADEGRGGRGGWVGSGMSRCRVGLEIFCMYMMHE